MTTTHRKPITPRRRPKLQPAAPPDICDVLRTEIDQLCRQVDRRLQNRPGTAMRAVAFWYYPLTDIRRPEVLVSLHSDAAALLITVINEQNEELAEWP